MEKLIYVLKAGPVAPVDPLAEWGHLLIEASRAAGSISQSLLIPDQTETIRTRAPARLSPNFDSVGIILESWFDSLDARHELESAIAKIDSMFWGYLVTESTFGVLPEARGTDGRVEGITQVTLNKKPKGVSDEAFYREWQEVHSKLSFELHPTRLSYERNSIARRLTPNSPRHRAIVLERFPRLEDFVDESIYFGDPEVVQKMFAHVPKFYEFDSAITGAMSEYRFGGSTGPSVPA